jgi:hypothetical protein
MCALAGWCAGAGKGSFITDMNVIMQEAHHGRLIRSGTSHHCHLLRFDGVSYREFMITTLAGGGESA